MGGWVGGRGGRAGRAGGRGGGWVGALFARVVGIVTTTVRDSVILEGLPPVSPRSIHYLKRVAGASR